MPTTRQRSQQVLKPKRKAKSESRPKRSGDASLAGSSDKKKRKKNYDHEGLSVGEKGRKTNGRVPSKKKKSSRSGTSSRRENESKEELSDNKAEVLLSEKDKAPQLRLLRGQLRVRGSGGYSLIRGTHGTRRGQWYYECTPLRPYGNFRIGWAQKFTLVQGPVGMDRCSFAYCDNGASYSSGERNDDYGEAWALSTRCTIGCLLDIDAKQIRFFYNGKDQGCAFASIPRGAFFPAVSVFGNGLLRVNFGPRFKFPPPQDTFTYEAISALALARAQDACFISDIKIPDATRPRLSLDDDDDDSEAHLPLDLNALRQQRFTSTRAASLLLESPPRPHLSRLEEEPKEDHRQPSPPPTET